VYSQDAVTRSRLPLFALLAAAAMAITLGACPREPGDPPPCARAPTVTVATSGQKVCQLTGDEDRALAEPTLNRTFTRYGLSNTDLGASFEYDGKLWFLFGDSFPTGGGAPNPLCGDAIAFTAATSFAGCPLLSFVAAPSGTFQSPVVPGIDLGCYDVPLHGVSTGTALYAWFSTGCMSRSILARSDDAQSFSAVGTLSDCNCDTTCSAGPGASCLDRSCHFVNVSAAIVPEGAAVGLPGDGDRLLLFGSGVYRQSNVYLAVTSLSQIEDFAAIRYFGGADATSCAPQWSSVEAEAAPLFDTTNDNGNTEPCVGELSVHFDTALGRWVALYNCNHTLDAIRVADSPWGPWSAAAPLFESSSAYCDYIFRPDAGCPQLADHPGDEEAAGDTYGPYAIGSYSQVTDAGAQLFFTMSPRNPYNVMLMTATVSALP
jgi:hypothetical protein